MNMFLLILHNLIRWGILFGGLYAITKSVLGLMKKREFTSSENRSHVIFVMLCHVQLLLGLILYFTGDRVKAALSGGMGEAMKNTEMRFWAIEHITGMIIAVILIQLGRTFSKKATDPMSKHRKAVIFFSLGMLVILLTIPWKYSPLYRF